MTRTLIVGIGAVGGVLAAGLILAGETPILATGRPELQERLACAGLRVEDDTGGTVLAVNAVVDAQALPEQLLFDTIFLATKAAAAIELSARLRPRLAPDGYLVTLQNGFIIDAVAAAVGGAERVIGGVTGLTAVMTAPGVYRRTSRGALYLGELDGCDTPRLQLLAERLTRVAPTHVSSNISGALWSKLCLNCSITALAGLTGLPLAKLLENTLGRQVFLSALHEVVSTASARDVRLEPLAFEPELLRIEPRPGWLEAEKTTRLLRALIEAYGHGKPSVLHSLEQGRKTEIDYLTGYVARTAAEMGKPAPLNQAITHVIHEIEDGRSQIGTQNLPRLVALCPTA